MENNHSHNFIFSKIDMQPINVGAGTGASFYYKEVAYSVCTSCGDVKKTILG